MKIINILKIMAISIALITMIIWMNSCNKHAVTTTKEQYGVTSTVKEIPLTNRPWSVDFTTITYDNHELILWLNGNASQMMHHPDCKTCKNKN